MILYKGGRGPGSHRFTSGRAGQRGRVREGDRKRETEREREEERQREGQRETYPLERARIRTWRQMD